MRRRLVISALFLLTGCSAEEASRRSLGIDAATWSNYAATAAAIRRQARATSGAHDLLRELCDDIGHRLSGSPQLEQATQWAADTMRRAGHENVRLEPVSVTHWVRGNERCTLVEPREMSLTMLGLGGSIATPPGGLTAEVVVVTDEAELEKLGQGAAGKFVLFNNAMPKYDPEHGSGYGKTVRFRGRGAILAARKGAVGCLIRSVTAHSLRTPHTGMMRYEDDVPKIPAAALSVEDAEKIARLVGHGKRVVVRLEMEAQTMPQPAMSANVVAELRGREKPDEVVVIGGHIDSWDVGDGAHDDGAGCVMAMEALSLLRRGGFVPRRTIRVVLWTNEENGLAGAETYARDHAAELPLHVAAIESDSGAFKPEGFGYECKDKAAEERAGARLAAISQLLAPLGATKLQAGWSGADVSTLESSGTLLLGLEVEGSRYFNYHHTPADTFDKVDKAELQDCVATMATMAYLLADLPERVTR